jgi:8-amino-7-oxononanoate synthase
MHESHSKGDDDPAREENLDERRHAVNIPERSPAFDWLREELEERSLAGLLRTPAVREVDPTRDFSSNDYLGLRRDPRLHRAGVAAAEEAGCGAGSSPAVSGWSKPYERLVRTLAEWKVAEAALVFTSGYAANVSIVSGLVGPGDVVYADRLAHASLIDGVRVSMAKLRVFRHNDPHALEEAIMRDEGNFRRRLILTESVFSMDGDSVSLKPLVEVAERFECMLLVDEAHATGVFGPEGRGLIDLAGYAGHPAIVRMGTLSKALGCQGGYVVGSKELIAWLIQAGRGWIYSTALSPYLAGAATEAICIVREDDSAREKVCGMAELLRSKLKSDGWSYIDSMGPIVPVEIGDVAKVMKIGAELAAGGFAIGTIRPPTVPAGTARLRISVNALHSEADIQRLTDALKLARRTISG